MKSFREFLYEMAFSRSDAENKISFMAPETVEHICKIIADPNHTSSNHWKTEVYNWCNKASNIKIKKNKKPSKNDIIDWLFDTSIDDTQKNKFKNNIEGIIKIYGMKTKYNDKMWNQYLSVRDQLADIICDDSINLKKVFEIFENM